MKSSLYALLFAAVFVLPAFAQNVRVDGVVQSRTGIPAAGAQIAVCTQPANTTTTPCSPVALICSSLTDTVCTQPNPVTADGLGNYFFYLVPGLYTYQFYGSGLTTRVLPDQAVGLGASTPTNPTASLSVTPTSIPFGSVQTGNSTSGNVNIQNTSAAASVGISGISFSGVNASDFSSSTPTSCNGSLAAGSFCILPITFTPSTTSAETATLTINTTIGPFTVPMTGTGQATPSFLLTVNPSGNGSGSVQSGDGTSPCPQGQVCTPPSIICSMIGAAANGDCSSSYPSGTVIVLTATPTTGNSFVSFTGGGCSTSPCSITLTSTTLVKAQFSPVAVSEVLNISATGQGTGLITSDTGGISCTSTAGVLSGICSASYPQGTNVLLTETPSTIGNGTCVGASCTFTAWGGATNCVATPALSTCQVTMSAQTNVSAGFAAPAGGAPVQLIQTINGGTAGTNKVTGTFSGAQAVGDTNIVYVLWNNNTTTISSVTDSAGNTYTQAAGCSPETIAGLGIALYHSVSIVAAGAGANTVTVNMSASPSFRILLASEYSGVSAFDACSGATGSGTAVDSGAFTSTANNDLLIGGDNVAHSISVVSSGFKQEIANSGNDVEDQTNVAAAAYHFLPTQAPTGNWTAIGAAFKTAGAVGQIRFSFNIVGGGSGTGTVSAAGISCTVTAGVPTGTCSTSVASGGTLTLTATPASGSIFTNYQGAGCGTSPTCVTSAINTNTVTTVNFGFPSSSGPFNVLNPPSVTNRPYPSAYYNKKLPGAGAGGPTSHLMTNSDTIVAQIFSTSPVSVQAGLWTNGLGTNDAQHRPVIYGQATDPVYIVQGCTAGPQDTPVNGQTFHAPSQAPYSQSDNDEEIVIWDQTTDQMFQFYNFNSCTTNCLATVAKLPACSGTAGSPCPFNHNGNGYCSAQNHTTGSGINAGSAASTAGLAPFGNIIRFTEILNVGHINHGLRAITDCDGTNSGIAPSFTVFPANQSGGGPASKCGTGTFPPDTNRPPNGSVFFLDYTQAQLNCFDPSQAPCGGITKLPAWQFMLIEAATFYGITIEDTGHGNNLTLSGTESDIAYRFFDSHGFPGALAQATAWTNYMNANCTTNCIISPRSNGSIEWELFPWLGISNVVGTGVTSHLHIVDPCVIIQMQGLPNDGHGTNACFF